VRFVAKVKLVSLGDGTTPSAFRDISAYVARRNKDTESYYVHPNRYRTRLRGVKATVMGTGNHEHVKHLEVIEIARGLAGCDLVALFPMARHAELTKKIVLRIRELDASAYLAWGGIDPIIGPDETIRRHLDAICTRDSPSAFEGFFDRFLAGGDVREADHFWFPEGDSVPREGDRQRAAVGDRQRSAECDPGSEVVDGALLSEGAREKIYRAGKGFVPVDDFSGSRRRLVGQHRRTGNSAALS
jgi:hypothetical protein